MDNLINILLQRNDSSVDWGFHLALDHENQMVIDKVEDGTMCSFYMSPGDAVLQVAGRSTKAMTVQRAQRLITQAGNAVEVIIKNISVFKALRAPNRHSNRVIDLLVHQISTVIEQIISIEFVWTPGHSKINENELVDSLASAAQDTKFLSWICHEDLGYISKKFEEQEFNNLWLNSPILVPLNRNMESFLLIARLMFCFHALERTLILIMINYIDFIQFRRRCANFVYWRKLYFIFSLNARNIPFKGKFCVSISVILRFPFLSFRSYGGC
ncbi:hypothetical protein AVEN_133448-1 [Araneus ventricosus]|uniref:PDZ domain-containing protein n=1 Tax=Araneus ventricosus TaxID=182803 RepID=A0A4Y2H6B2_ARAVE|nr:hypothetical protein AVEN_133448-1 [Araneus ventricosus]